MVSARDLLAPEKEILVLTATSGDTGSATMAGFRGMPGVRVIVFYPQGGVSAVQAAQMQRMAGSNVRAVAIKGDFDRTQAGVKAIFRQAGSVAPHLLLSSANSINIGRLIPQMAYYYDAYRQLGAQGQAVYSVPTGNFGDILAGHLARLAGLPIANLICATNANSVLHEALQGGVYDKRRALVKTLSPSMDILLSSNFERALYLACDGDSAMCGALMLTLEEESRLVLPRKIWHDLQQYFSSEVCTDIQALDVIRMVWQEKGYLLDPHSASAWHALKSYDHDSTLQCAGVVLSTASPYKFPAACLRAMGIPIPKAPEEQWRILQSETGLPFPRALEGLFRLPILHSEVIEVSAMANYVKEKAISW
jgi:threonine synthase